MTYTLDEAFRVKGELITRIELAQEHLKRVNKVIIEHITNENAEANDNTAGPIKTGKSD